jgi:hypothetical protein
MKLTIEATDKLTQMDGVAVRVWTGRTESGIPCTVFVHRIAVSNSENSEQFDRELKEQLPPGRTFDLRQVL